jgi:hypothetical protein
VQEGCFAGVVEAEEKQFGMFVEKTEGCKDIPEPSSTHTVQHLTRRRWGNGDRTAGTYWTMNMMRIV